MPRDGSAEMGQGRQESENQIEQLESSLETIVVATDEEISIRSREAIAIFDEQILRGYSMEENKSSIKLVGFRYSTFALESGWFQKELEQATNDSEQSRSVLYKLRRSLETPIRDLKLLSDVESKRSSKEMSDAIGAAVTKAMVRERAIAAYRVMGEFILEKLEKSK